MLEKLYHRLSGGGRITESEACYLLEEAPFDDLCRFSHEITRKFASNRFHRCSIINVKSGSCSEDCCWCAQSARYHTGSPAYGLVSGQDCVRQSIQSQKQQVQHLSLVASGKKIDTATLNRICDYVRQMRECSGISVCVSLGLLDESALRQLARAGVSRYHCNLETAPSFFNELCTTHTQEEKIATLRSARKAGMEICSGGIIGMGEHPRQRVELAMKLRELEVPSIPLNILHPIPGTPLEHVRPLGKEEFLRTVAMFRFVHPGAYLRFAGGRSQLDDATQAQALYTGINAAIVGDMLTTPGSDLHTDRIRIKNAGYEY